MFEDNDLISVMNEDDVNKVELRAFENVNKSSISEIKDIMGEPPWAVRLVYNDLFGGVLICQNPGEGCRFSNWSG